VIIYLFECPKCGSKNRRDLAAIERSNFKFICKGDPPCLEELFYNPHTQVVTCASAGSTASKVRIDHSVQATQGDIAHRHFAEERAERRNLCVCQVQIELSHWPSSFVRASPTSNATRADTPHRHHAHTARLGGNPPSRARTPLCR
jgi:hypothetical protein